MEKLGASIESMHKEEKREFSLMTFLLTMAKMVDRIRDIHDKGIIHRDIKPENFLFSDMESNEKRIDDASELKIYESENESCVDSTNDEDSAESEEETHESTKTKFNYSKNLSPIDESPLTENPKVDHTLNN